MRRVRNVFVIVATVTTYEETPLFLKADQHEQIILMQLGKEKINRCRARRDIYTALRQLSHSHCYSFICLPQFLLFTLCRISVIFVFVPLLSPLASFFISCRLILINNNNKGFAFVSPPPPPHFLLELGKLKERSASLKRGLRYVGTIKFVSLANCTQRLIKEAQRRRGGSGRNEISSIYNEHVIMAAILGQTC